MALLEALVALVLVATAGGVTVSLASQATAALAASRAADDELRRASGLLDAVALWTREDLNRHLGDRTEGPEGRWTLRVLRPAPNVYAVALFVSPSGGLQRHPGRLLLATTLYRRPAQ